MSGKKNYIALLNCLAFSQSHRARICHEFEMFKFGLNLDSSGSFVMLSESNQPQFEFKNTSGEKINKSSK